MLMLCLCLCLFTSENQPINDCTRFYPHADHNMVWPKLIVRHEVAVDSVHHLVDSLDSGTQVNAERILPFELLVRQIQYLLHKWEMFAVRAASCTSVLPIRLCQLYGLSASDGRVAGSPNLWNINIYQEEFLKKRNKIYLVLHIKISFYSYSLA